MTQARATRSRSNRRWLKPVAGSTLLLVVIVSGAMLYFASLEPERSEEYRLEYERVADRLYSDPQQARRNFELIASRPAGAALGDLDLSAGVWQPFVPRYERPLPEGRIDISALSRSYWDPAFEQLRVALTDGNDADLRVALAEVFARMRCMRDISPDSKALSWTEPVNRLRRQTLQLVRGEPDITPEALDSLAASLDAVPELPDFGVFLDLAVPTFSDMISNHHSDGGWFLPTPKSRISALWQAKPFSAASAANSSTSRDFPLPVSPRTTLVRVIGRRGAIGSTWPRR